MKTQYTTKKFIQRAKEIHGGKYDYSLVEYKSCKKKIVIICPIHGKFEQIPDSHIRGSGCPKCSNNKKKTDKLFISEARKIHEDKYDYSLVEYVNSHKKIIIICPIHGKFEQTPNSHIRGCGCPNCGRITTSNKIKLNLKKFIKKAKEIHGDKYDYSLVDYIDSKTPIKIICKTHGIFEQTPKYHLKSKGFSHPNHNHNEMTTKDFIKKAKEIHGDKYDYSLVDYIDSKTPIKIICKTHGIFEQTPNCHLTDHGCYRCNLKNNKLENKIFKLLENKQISFQKNNRTAIAPKEIDCFFNKEKIGIEIHGLRWHGELFLKDKNYHLTKLEKCQNKGIRLYQFFEDEINNKFPIINSKINTLFKINKYPIYARNCKIKEIDIKSKNTFLNKYHLQGKDNSSIKLGLFYRNRLISVMTFCKRRLALGKKYSEEGEYELSRFCGNFSFYIIGGASKLLKYFERNYNPTKIITYADKRYSFGDLYFKLGFLHSHDSPPNYWYTKHNNDRIHRFNFRKNVLNKKLEKFNPNKTEWENMKDNGWDRIWDCGNIVFEKVIKQTPHRSMQGRTI